MIVTLFIHFQYIPPLWLHDFSAELPSMSVAIWSASRDDGISDALTALGLPIADRSVSLRKQVFKLLFFFPLKLV
jgi:hypothetical protein